MLKLPDAIVLMGPTASGKTDLAIELCQHLPCDIISVDSALVYKGMNIGTAKPTAEELEKAPHRLINILDPLEAYSAADFCQDAFEQIESIQKAGRIPLLVGGTMLYFKSLLEGISPLPAADASIRAQIEQEAQEHGWLALHEQLKVVDPQSAERIHPNDPQRLMRALEVYRKVGKSLTELNMVKGRHLSGNVLKFAIAPKERETLWERIEQRFHRMIEQGFEQEVRALYERGDLHLALPSMRCVGYRQMWEYLDAKLSFDEMVFRGIVATRQLAKKQMTWLRGWENLNWLDSLEENNHINVMKHIEME